MHGKFNEHDEQGQYIQRFLEITMKVVEVGNKVHFRNPHHDIARRFLNEIEEFEALDHDTTTEKD